MSNVSALICIENHSTTLRSQYITTGHWQERRQELGLGMRHEKITYIPFDDFIARFVPNVLAPHSLSDSDVDSFKHEPSTERDAGRPDAPSSNPFKDMPRATVEKDMYKNITDALSGAGLTTEFEFVSTPYKGDSSERSGQAVDCGMYPKEGVDHLGPADDEGHRRMNWTWIEIAIECKMSSTDDDPFDEARDMRWQPVAVGRREVLGQVLDYARLIFLYQQRMFQFMVLFLGDMARIVRIDRSGIFATHKFNYRNEGGLKLARFFRNYASLSRVERGHDPTATRLDPCSIEAEKMRARVQGMNPDDHIMGLFANTLDEQWPWWKVQVPDGEREGQIQTRSFLVGKPHFMASGIAGSATRGYVALDASDPEGPPMYLKDTWRVISEDLEQEGILLQRLHEHKVRFIPTPICHGDLLGQETRGSTVWPGYYLEDAHPLERYQHYRLVTKEVGKPLEQFQHSFELACALWCCIYAHAQAYKKAKIIHCDVSTDNILLYRNSRGMWQGMLNGWKLSKRCDQPGKHGRQYSRTGTWQFMSVKALRSRGGIPIRIEDELESFFHVLLNVSLRFLPHNLPKANLSQFLDAYFGNYRTLEMEYRCGAAKDFAMQAGFIDISIYRDNPDDSSRLHFHFQFFPDPPTSGATHAVEPIAALHPLDGIIKTWLSWFGAYYILPGMPELRSCSSKLSPGTDVEEKNRACLEQINSFERMKADIEAGSDTEDDIEAGNDTGDDESPPSPTVRPSTVDDTLNVEADARYRAALAERANNLASHAATLALFRSVLSKDTWPPQPDRITEKEPSEDQLLPTEGDIPIGESSREHASSTGDSMPEDITEPSN